MEAPSSGGTEEASEGPKIRWNPGKRRFESEDKKAYLEYELIEDGKVMDLIHTFVPPSNRGLGLASFLCLAAFNHAKTNSLLVVPSCSYIFETFLPKNPSWNSLVYSDAIKASI